MKRPIPRPLAGSQGFSRLTPVGYSCKDASFFSWNGDDYIICTDNNSGGLVLFKKISGTYQFFQSLFPGWGRMWAPCAVIENGKLYIFCNDTGGVEPFWETQRIKYFELIPGVAPNNPIEVQFDNPKGMIDAEVVKIGDNYVMFYVIMDWNYTAKGWEWWDVYYSTSDTLTGPYHGEHNISQMKETGIEEAPCVIGDKLYWSSEASDYDSYISRGDLVWKNGVLEVDQDQDFVVNAVGSVTCTHPSNNSGNLAATLKADDGEFYIGEIN